MRIRTFVSGLAVVSLLAAGAGVRARGRLKARYQPPGRLVDVGGHRLHLFCQGEGDPPVIIEAGLGDIGLSWSLVQPDVARFTQVCVYDRAGLGWSDSSPRPRTAEVMLEELRTVLSRSGIPGPYVLVGASLGGLVVRLFADRYPADVAGLVLVDSAHEEQFSPEPIRQALQRMQRLMPLMYGSMRMLVWSGVAALRPSLVPDASGVTGKLPRPAAETYRALVAADPKHVEAAAAEMRALEETHAQMRAAAITSLGDLPLVVIRHGAPQPMMASAEVGEIFEETFARLQEELAGLSTNGRLVVATESGHVIQVDQPDVVVAAIREVVDAARERAKSGATGQAHTDAAR